MDGGVSSWKPVLSGVPQGSVRLLGPILFLVYINDLEEGVTCNILKFADATRLFRKTIEIGDKQNLQDDIDKLVRWSEKWQMLFNFGKVWTDNTSVVVLRLLYLAPRIMTVQFTGHVTSLK